MRQPPGEAARPVLRRSPRPWLVYAYRSPAYRSWSRLAPTRHRWPVGCPLPDNGAGNFHRQGRRNCSMTAQAFADQVSLLVRAIPEIAREDIFALKGGTAIHLFVRDLPRARKRVAKGKSGSLRVDLGGGRTITQKHDKIHTT